MLHSGAWLALGRMGLWLGVLGLAAWTRWPWVGWLVFSAFATLAALAVRPKRGAARTVVGLVVLAAIAAASYGHRVSRQVSLDFDAYWEARAARAEAAVGDRLGRLLDSGNDAVRRIGDLWASGPEAELLEGLRDVRRRTGMAAAAIRAPDGGFLVWDGTHRGTVPPELSGGTLGYLYRDRPLFSYLYFTAPIPGGGSAMAAALVKANLPRGLESDPGDFVTSFREGVGEGLRILGPSRAGEDDVLGLPWGGEPLFSVSIVRPTPEQRLFDVHTFWSRIVGGLAVIAWLLLAATAGRGDRVAAALTPLGLAFLIPVGEVMGSLLPIYTAADFTLPGPLSVTLERVLLLAVAGAVVVAAHPPPSARLGPLATGLAVLAAFPLASVLLVRGAGPTLLSGGEGKWIMYQLGVALVLTLLCLGAFRLGERARRLPRAALVLAGALVLALGLLAAGAAWTRVEGALPAASTAAWFLPAALAGYGLSGVRGWRRIWTAWGSAAVLGASAALVVTWSARVESRMDFAELQLGRLGTPPDPDLERLLYQFADAADSLDAERAGPAELVYESWVSSGLAEEGSGVWLTLWSPDGLPEFEIAVGVEGEKPERAGDSSEAAGQADAPFVRRLAEADANYVVQVPLSRGRALTGVVPPRRELPSTTPLGSVFGGLTAPTESPLTLVPILEGDEAGPANQVAWARTEDGWEARQSVAFPDGGFDAQYTVGLAGPLQATARGGLLILGDLAVILVLWALGRFILVGRRPAVRSWRNPLASFRTRVTLALFAFFVLSAALFGSLALRTLSDATVRAAAAIAARIAADAAAFYYEAGRSMALLSSRVGADLLEYRAGELRGGSVDEAVEMGLYDGWIPYEVNQKLESRQELLETALGSLGRRQYLMAFRRLPDGDVVATQVPLQAGATALRQREVAELVAFVVLLGAGLSLGLALLAGRTLTSPIRTLQVASERVGDGNLAVRLPEARADEFGAVFRAFNRMVLRISRARRDLVRTTRRTQAIVDEAATGVVALDPAANVTLVNPRAQTVLGGLVEVGTPLPRLEGTRAELVEWMEERLRDGLREAASEFQVGERRIRVRSREISRQGPGGVVLSIEDVTDELRTERILAWGEMARQVAHEVKNPLTPIKLSVQHIRRAWRDRRGDFEPILDRNVGAILGEIDRLAEIASGFSRFGAPAAAGEAPLEPVDVGSVVQEVLTLYRVGEEGPVHFEARVSDDLPPVSARHTELKEVLVNLLENARVAIEGAGSVVIEAESGTGDVEIRVRDDGVGIPPDVLTRIFEPQFSTRSAGTGLGLAIVQKLVRSWDGEVTADSRRGKGTAIRVRMRPWEESEDRPSDGAGDSAL